MLHGDTATAWALYDELMEKGLSPNQDTWDVLFKGLSKIKDEGGEGTETMSQTEHQERLLDILLFMRNNQIYPQQSLGSSIKTWFERYDRVINILMCGWETEAGCTFYCYKYANQLYWLASF